MYGRFDHKTMPESARRLFKAAYPSYRGRTFSLQTVPDEKPTTSVRSYWDEGCRDYFVVIGGGRTLQCPTSSGFDFPLGTPEIDAREVPADGAVVSLHVRRGKQAGLHLIVRESRLQEFQPFNKVW